MKIVGNEHANVLSKKISAALMLAGAEIYTRTIEGIPADLMVLRRFGIGVAFADRGSDILMLLAMIPPQGAIADNLTSDLEINLGERCWGVILRDRAGRLHLGRLPRLGGGRRSVSGRRVDIEIDPEYRSRVIGSKHLIIIGQPEQPNFIDRLVGLVRECARVRILVHG
jgi:hypothetical protein